MIGEKIENRGREHQRDGKRREAAMNEETIRGEEGE
jgi:hypothetical protein